MKRTILALALLAAVITGCGKKTPAVLAGPPAQATPVLLTSAELCRRDLLKHVQFNDPESVRIRSIAPESDHTKGHHKMLVSAKNGHGGYGAPLPCDCVAKPAEDSVTYLYCAQPD